MSLDQYQVYSNAQLSIGDESGYVVSADANTVELGSYETGKVTKYLTPYIMEHGEVVEPPAEPAESQSPSTPTSNFTAPTVTTSENASPSADATSAPTDSPTVPDSAPVTPDESATPVTPVADSGSRQNTP